MRQELINFLDGVYPEISKKQIVLLRKMRRDSDGALVECACVDETTKEPDLDVFCPLCHGDGYYWAEDWLDVYSVLVRSDVGQAWKERQLSATTQNIDTMIFYTSYSSNVTVDDKIVTLKLNKDGTVYRPYQREDIYRIGTVIDMRADNGRLEFWKIAAYREKRKFLNGPNS